MRYKGSHLVEGDRNKVSRDYRQVQGLGGDKAGSIQENHPLLLWSGLCLNLLNPIQRVFHACTAAHLILVLEKEGGCAMLALLT